MVQMFRDQTDNKKMDIIEAVLENLDNYIRDANLENDAAFMSKLEAVVTYLMTDYEDMDHDIIDIDVLKSKKLKDMAAKYLID